MQARRSVRRYSERPVSRAALERLLEAARWAPSAHNRQPWRFAVLIEPEPRSAPGRGDGRALPPRSAGGRPGSGRGGATGRALGGAHRRRAGGDRRVSEHGGHGSLPRCAPPGA
ncbi:MAG: nitroreductase family protein [Anaerolineae bacterium]|nr:nitroreductase family protein [Anaerolineae bacterium]